jgi:hypothetical protein
VISKAAIAEVKQPLSLNLGTSLETISRQNPLIKNVNKPKVINVIGNEMNSRTGLIVMLTKANTRAAIIAAKKLSISKSPVRRPTAYIEKERIKK